jgi:hypothetical protein
MPDWFQRLPGFRRTPAGIERPILRSLTKVLVYGTLLLMLPSLLVRLAGEAPADAGGASATMTVDILVAGLLFLHWNVLLTVATLLATTSTDLRQRPRSSRARVRSFASGPHPRLQYGTR